MTSQEAIEKLNKLDSGGKEDNHIKADLILQEFLATNGNSDVSDAYQECRNRVGFWYS